MSRETTKSAIIFVWEFGGFMAWFVTDPTARLFVGLRAAALEVSFLLTTAANDVLLGGPKSLL